MMGQQIEAQPFLIPLRQTFLPELLQQGVEGGFGIASWHQGGTQSLG